MKTLKQLTRSVLACLLCIGLLYSIPTIAYADVDWPQVTDFSIIATSVPLKDTDTMAERAAEKDTVYTKDVTSNNIAKKAEAKTIDRYVIKQYDTLEKVDDGSFIAGEIRLYTKEKVTDNFVYIWQKSWQAKVTKGTAACIQGKTTTGKPSTYSISLKSASNYVNSNTFYVEDNGVKYYYKVMLVNSFEITQFEEPYRISETAAEIKINTQEAASCYYAVVDSGAAKPEIDTSGTGIPLRVGDNSVPVTLTAGAKDVYVAARNEDGTIKTLKIEIGEALSTSTLTLYLSFSISPTFIKAEVNGKAASAETTNNVTVISDLHYNDSVKIWLQPKDTTKCISEASLVSAQRANKDAAQALYYNPNVNSTENSITFTMPAVAALRDALYFDGTKENGWLHYADAVVASHNLTAKVSKIWEHNPEGPSNSKGILTFTDENGAAITVAKEGSKVIAIAQPRDVSWYEFKFVEWTEEQGVKISGADRKNPRLEFEMGTEDVYLFAKFENVGTNVEWGTNIPEVNNVVSVHCNSNGEVNPFVYKTGSAARFTLVAATTVGWQDAYAFDGWTILRDGNEVPENEITYEVYGKPGEVGYYTVPTVTVGGSNMKVTANFHARKIAAVTATVNDSAMGSATVAVGTGTPGTNIPAVFEGQTVTLTATPGERYMLKGWEVKDADKNDVTYTVAEDVVNVATFIMPDTGKDITAKAIFKVDPNNASTACVLEDVELAIPSATVENTGTSYTITVPANTDADTLAAAVLKFTVSKYADVVTADGSVWPEDGKACGMTLDTPVTFTVRSEKCRIGKDDTAKADYTVTITKAKSSEKDITAVKLLNADKSVIAEGKLSGTTWTITLPSNTDKALINKIGSAPDVFMQINYTGVSLAQAEGYDDATGIIGKWSSGNVMCGISPNSSKTFTVTAEDGSTKTYTVEIKYTAPNAPTLSNGSATRTSKTGATVKFTSSEAGTYFYKVVTHGAAAPTVDEIKKSTTKGTASAGETTFTFSNLIEDARDIYIVVVGAAGGESAALKVEIPAYGSGSETPDTGKFTISVNAPKGGKITTNRTKADKGDEIIVTVTPDSGYQMADGSLTYSLAVAGGETVKITGNRFTMPAGNVTITCKWETATTTAKGITSFSINGVAGAVNNSTNTITITMPRGTDVTKLTPVIATNGVKSLTPGNGVTVDFTNAVTYTAAMEDGSSKTYTVTVYVDKGTLADQFWDKLTDFATQVPWWQYAEKQQSTSKYPKYW